MGKTIGGIYMDITTYALLKKKIDQLGISDSKIEEVIACSS